MKKLDADTMAKIAEHFTRANRIINSLIPLLDEKCWLSTEENGAWLIRILLNGASSQLDEAKKIID